MLLEGRAAAAVVAGSQPGDTGRAAHRASTHTGAKEKGEGNTVGRNVEKEREREESEIKKREKRREERERERERDGGKTR